MNCRSDERVPPTGTSIMRIQKNMSRIDRTMRFFVGLTLLILHLTDVIAGAAALIFAVVMLGSSFLGVCGFYLPFKYQTCEPAEYD